MKTTLMKLHEAIAEIDKLKEAETNLQTAVKSMDAATNRRDYMSAEHLHNECMKRVDFHGGAVRFLLTVASQALLDEAERIKKERAEAGSSIKPRVAVDDPEKVLSNVEAMFEGCI
jgi:hypothetical protein